MSEYDDIPRRVFTRTFKPREQFQFGWRKHSLDRITLHSFCFGPWDWTLMLIDKEAIEEYRRNYV